jgi:hypothetical protein
MAMSFDWLGLLMILGFVALYLLPSIVAVIRFASETSPSRPVSERNKSALDDSARRLTTVVLADVFLGWSILGYIWALGMALKPRKVKDHVL